MKSKKQFIIKLLVALFLVAMLVCTCVQYQKETISYPMAIVSLFLDSVFSALVYVSFFYGEKKMCTLMFVMFLINVLICVKFYFETPYRIFKNKGGYIVTVRIDSIRPGRPTSFSFSTLTEKLRLRDGEKSYYLRRKKNIGDCVIILLVNKGEYVRMISDCPSDNQKISYMSPVYVDTSTFEWDSLLY